MPLIDDISVVPYSAKKAMTVVTNQPRFHAAIIENLKGLLVSCGWTLVSSTPAQGVIFYPTGFPTSGGGSGTCGCGATYVIITTQSNRYVFCAYAPGQTPLPNGCFMFQLGITPVGSLTSLATCIQINTPYNAVLTTVSGVPAIVLTAKLVGPFHNLDTIFADGRFGVTSGATFGGGYTLQSVGSSPYTVELTSVFGFGTIDVQFNFTLGPTGMTGPASYAILADSPLQYTMVANPYSFAVFDGVNIFNSIAAFAPCIPISEGFTSAYAAFVVGPGNLTNQLMWQGGPEGQPCTNSLDGTPVTFADNLRGPQVLVMRTGLGNLPAFTLNNQPLLTASYCMMSGTYGGAPTVVGKLWDCMVLSKSSNLGDIIQSGGRSYVCISSQSGTGKTTCSLFFCFNDNGQPNAGAGDSGGSTNTGGSGDGGGSSPVNPSAPPGTGNGSFSGTCTSTGVPNSHTVFWESGQQFDPSMVGQTLTITLFGLAHPWVSAGGGGDATGTIPIVASIISSTELTTTQDLNSAFNSAPFTCP